MKYNILLLLLLHASTMLWCDDKELQAQDLLKQAKAAQQAQEYQAAIDYYTALIALKPGSSGEYFDLAYCHSMLGQVPQALASYRKILDIMPNCVSVLYNVAYLLKMADDLDKAIPIYLKTIELDPSKEDTYFGLAMAYLVKGDFDNGWRVHERFLNRTGRNANTLRQYLQHNDLAGKTILLRPEGGLGDTIQFLRYAKKLKQHGARIIAIVQRELYPLVQHCEYIDQLMTVGSVVPCAYDDTTTFMSMAAIWYPYHKEIVQEIPYITPDQDRSAYWKEYLCQDTNFKIGICWGASIHNDKSRAPIARRGIPLSQLYPLHDIPGVSLYSLQRFDGEDELLDVPEDISIKTFGPDFDRTHGAFVDSAAIIQHLDLVISVDTATAHLTGALGKPVFLMLPYSTDWRWIAHRTTSPWYPSMHIFKQARPFDWNTVVQDICLVVSELAQQHMNSQSES